MSSRFARLGASALLILGSGLLATITASSASADVPPTAVGEFEASPCAGETNLADPALTIAGTDLANYNAGSVVALYDSWGYAASADSFPPLCAVRYVSEAAGGPVGGGPVSAWMFCSDGSLAVCHDGSPLNAVGGNDRLSDFDQRVFAYIVTNGHTFQLLGDDYPYGGLSEVTTAVADAGTSERDALQYLLWCVTDYSTPLAAPFSEFCDLNGLDPASVESEYGFLMDTPLPGLTITSPASVVDASTTDTFTLVATAISSPITLAIDNGTLALCAGETDATLAGNILTLTSSAETVDVQLCAKPVSSSPVVLSGSVQADSPNVLNWFHNGNADCQIFALFSGQHLLTATASTDVAAKALAATGAANTVALTAFGAVALLIGAVVVARRKTRVQ